MLRKDAVVDGCQGVQSREAECKHREMPLQTGVDGETPRGGIHARHVLRVVDVLEGKLRAVVPMAVVEVLTDQSVWLYCEVLIYLRHIHVVNEIDETLGARRTVVTTRLLLQWLLQDSLQHFRGCVEVEWHIPNQELLLQAVEFVIHQDSLARTSVTNQHDGAATLDEKVHKESHSCGFCCVYQGSLK